MKTTFVKRPLSFIDKYNYWISEAIIAIFILLWIYTGVSKLIEYESFKLQMIQSPLFSKYAHIVTFAGPILELLVAVTLVFKRSRRAGLLASFALMIFFSFYVYYLMTTMPNLPCSCGGVIAILNWSQHLAMNIILTFLALLGLHVIKKTPRA